MDHTEAVRLRATEKYVLGELAPEEREQFEEHYFECVECANDVKALVTFVTASRITFEEQAKAKATPPPKKAERSALLNWFPPAIAIPAFAALAIVVIFQNAITIPTLKTRVQSTQVAQVYESSFRLQGATRGESATKLRIHPNESFVLDFDFTPARSFPSYEGYLIDSSGARVLTFPVKSEEANKELHLAIPGGRVRVGSYDLVLVGRNGTANVNAKNEEVQRISFVVEARPE